MGINAKKILGTGFILLIAGILFGACAQERDPIDRVQPYALPKTFFIGEDYQSADDDPEFWSQNTMIDVGYEATRAQIPRLRELLEQSESLWHRLRTWLRPNRPNRVSEPT